MTKEINIYILPNRAFIPNMQRLLEQIWRKSMNIRIFCNSELELTRLDMALWTSVQLGFLPHAAEKDIKSEKQPILLADNWHKNQNNAEAIVFYDKYDDGGDSKAQSQENEDIDILDEVKERSVLPPIEDKIDSVEKLRDYRKFIFLVNYDGLLLNYNDFYGIHDDVVNKNVNDNVVNKKSKGNQNMNKSPIDEDFLDKFEYFCVSKPIFARIREFFQPKIYLIYRDEKLIWQKQLVKK